MIFREQLSSTEPVTAASYRLSLNGEGLSIQNNSTEVSMSLKVEPVSKEIDSSNLVVFAGGKPNGPVPSVNHLDTKAPKGAEEGGMLFFHFDVTRSGDSYALGLLQSNKVLL